MSELFLEQDYRDHAKVICTTAKSARYLNLRTFLYHDIKNEHESNFVATVTFKHCSPKLLNDLRQRKHHYSDKLEDCQNPKEKHGYTVRIRSRDIWKKDLSGCTSVNLSVCAKIC